ncbi:MAG: hypothetical protein R2861_12295 [Desulfobacterales bacterium]
MGEGLAAAKACEAIGRNPQKPVFWPDHAGRSGGFKITGIYALVIALLLLFVV